MNYMKAKQLLYKIAEPYQDDIDCEVCGYQGPPTDNGFCPKCGALGGKKFSVNIDPRNALKDNRRYEIPKDGISIYELDNIGRQEDFTY